MNRQTIIRIVVFLALLALIVWVGVHYQQDFELRNLRSLIQSYGVLAPLIFILLYILSVVLFLPGAVLTISGGLIFGPFWGVLYNICGAVIGASLAFLIARYLARDVVAAKTNNRLQQLMDGVEKEGWRFVAFVRLVPLFPFNLLNYALGLTPISLFHYVWASAVFMLPGTIAYTYLGSLGMDVIEGGGKELLGKIVFGIGLLILVSLLPYFAKKFRKNKR